MSRAPMVYADAGAVTGFSGYDVTVPTPGFYKMSLVHGGHPVAIEILYGPPRDPDTGEIMDRSWRFQATANGQPIDLDLVWPRCGRAPITATEAAYLTGLQAWAAEHAPASPQANPARRIDLLDADTPMPF